MESAGIDVGEALELGAKVCLIADDSDGDYERAINEIIAEYGSSLTVRLVTQNAELLCPEHDELRLTAVGRFRE